MQQPFLWDGDTLILNIRLQPRASRDEIVEIQADGRIKIRITAPPVDGAANKHLTRYLASTFKVRQADIELLSGETGRNKRIAITCPGTLPDLLKSTR